MNRRKTVNYLMSIGYERCQADSIIKKYGKFISFENPKDLNKVSDIIQGNWNEFMIFYGRIKRQYEKRGRKNTGTFKLY